MIMKKLKNPPSSIGLGRVIGTVLKLIFFVLLVGIFVIVYNIYSDFTNDETDDYGSLKQAVVQFGDDLNEMRDYLYLPQNEYNFFQSEAEVDPEKLNETPEDNQHIKGVEKFVVELAAQQSLEENQAKVRKNLEALIGDEGFIESLAELELTASSELDVDDEYGRFKISNADEALVQLLLNVENGELNIQSILGIETLVVKDDDLAEPIVSYLEEHEDEIVNMKVALESKKTAMKGLLEDEAMNETLAENSLKMNADPVEIPEGFEYYVMDSNDSPLLTILLDRKTGELKWGENNYTKVDDLKGPFAKKIKSLNGETDQIKAIKQKQESLEAYLKTDSFKTLSEGLTVSDPREEADRIYFDLSQNSDAELPVGSIIFDLSSGEIHFSEGGEGLEFNLEEILSGSKKKP